MTHHLTPRSARRLAECHPDLVRLFEAVLAEVDFTVLCGHRNQAEQDAAYAAGKSRLRWPRSRHNSLPSQAVDVVPYPCDWNDLDAFRALAAVVKRKAAELGIAVAWGGDWKGLIDMPHWELASTAGAAGG